ncbi:MAG: hypothetical protein UT20_C0017G0027 [Candidatus Levybacteria bacterium GW2011_GWA1_39_11]|nr:MAG: hypothetical protein UT20_C0017G0027 [Candidatus Levybacteria bacterium GW2011_GWA1_39_11]
MKKHFEGDQTASMILGSEGTYADFKYSQVNHNPQYSSLPYYECIATGSDTVMEQRNPEIVSSQLTQDLDISRYFERDIKTLGEPYTVTLSLNGKQENLTGSWDGVEVSVVTSAFALEEERINFYVAVMPYQNTLRHFSEQKGWQIIPLETNINSHFINKSCCIGNF